MKKLILLALVCTGFVVTTPFTAQALNSKKISPNLDLEPSMLLAQYDRDQNRDNQNRDNRDRDNRDRDSQDSRYRNRAFSVSYRSSDDKRWIFDSVHYSLRDARRAANRLERRGYRTLVLG
ncbi:hypothetical protein [Chamaesiphon sp. VAR_69_metabat_338]|uniref:hypothetical protein n=1 Tax=Chamaesiphon sp. VAR_69_metabat_338 TaxID=2964704 RepID=UPI00286DCD68|nr:hypothetical protein [Chamaesiphon sp. VAR_69_metabat_338]